MVKETRVSWGTIMNIEDFTSTLRHITAQYDQQIADIEEVLKELRELRNAATLLLEAEKAFQNGGPTESQEKPYAGKYAADVVVDVLLKNGNQPMHADDLTQALLDGGWVSRAGKPKMSVVGAIIRDHRFERTKMNTFRLTQAAEKRGGGAGE